MKKYFFTLILLLSLFLITGCKKSIIGRWKIIDTDNEYYYIFNNDNTCSYEMTIARLDCTYELDNDRIIILFNGNEKNNTYQYYFDENTLIIKDDTGKENKFVKN